MAQWGWLRTLMMMMKRMMIAHVDDDGQCSARAQVDHSYQRNRLKRFPSFLFSFVYLVALVWLKCSLYKTAAHTHTNTCPLLLCWRTNAKQTEIECNGNCVQICNILWNAHRRESVGIADGRRSGTAKEEWRKEYDDMTFFFIRFILIKIILKLKHRSWIELPLNGDNREMAKLFLRATQCPQASNHFTDIPFNGMALLLLLLHIQMGCNCKNEGN